jgi:hypothetical protein
MDANCQHLQLSAALLLVLLSLVQASTFSPTATSSDISSIQARDVSLQESARPAAAQNFTCSRDDDYLNKPK